METGTKASTLKYFSITKLFIAIITLVLVILPFVPYAMVFIPDEFPEDQWWRPIYILRDPILRIIYVLFAMLWVVFLFVKQPKTRRVMMGCLLVVSFCWLGLSVGAFTLAVQDLTPSYGVCVSVLLFPCFVVYLMLIRILNRQNSSDIQGS